MRFLIGPDSLKDSVSAYEFCEIAKKVILEYWPEDEVIALPLADGGEGTVEAMVAGSAGKLISIEATDPLGNKTYAEYGLIDDRKVAVIEMAAISGLPLVPVKLRNPMNTTTYGTGELIYDAIKRGCKKIIIGIGGSATSDAGIGMMQALGFQCLDKEGKDVPYGGKALELLNQIIPPTDEKGMNPFKDVMIEVACDVNNPLYGEKGAAYVYGPQKGADQQMVEKLDLGLRNFAKVVKDSLGIVVDTLPGGGAAGGLGAGLYASLGGILKPGFEIIKEQVGLEEKFKQGIDYVITSEGQMNHQSLHGKLPVELAKLANKYNTKTIAIVGSRNINVDEVRDFGIQGIFTIANGPITLEESMNQGKELIEDTLRNVIFLIRQ